MNQIAVMEQNFNKRTLIRQILLLLVLAFVSIRALYDEGGLDTCIVKSILFAYLMCSLIFHRSAGIFSNTLHPYTMAKISTAILVIPDLLFGDTAQQGMDPNILFGVTLSITLFVVGIDVMCWLVPLHSRRNQFQNKRSVPRPTFSIVNRQRPSDGLLASIYVALSMLRLAAFVAGKPVGTPLDVAGTADTFANLVGAAVQAAFLIFAVSAVMSRNRRLIFAMALVECAWGLVTGSKSAIIAVAAPLVFGAQRSWETKLTGRVAVFGALAILMSVLLFDNIQNYRLNLQTVMSNGENVTMESILASTMTKDPNYSSESGDLAHVFDRLNATQRFSAVVAHSDATYMRPLLGESLLSAVSWIVPRAIWPDKPDVSLGRWFAQEVLRWDPNSRAEAGVTLWGEGYINFGWAGAVLVPLLAWLTLGFLYYAAVRFGRWGFVWFLVMLPVFINANASNYGLLIAKSLQMALGIAIIGIVLDMVRNATTRRLEARDYPRIAHHNDS